MPPKVQQGQASQDFGYYWEDIRCGFRPSFLKILKSGIIKREELINAGPLSKSRLRDPVLVNAYEAFREQVRKKKYQYGEFIKFLHEHNYYPDASPPGIP